MNQLPPLEAKLERDIHRIPQWTREALMDCNDTLLLCWLSVQQVFGEKATPEQAIALLPIALGETVRAKARILAQFGRKTEDGDEPALLAHLKP